MPLPEAKRIVARAWFVGERIDVRALERGETVARAPLTVRAGLHGYAVLFRYGVVVFLETGPVEQASFLETLAPFVSSRFEHPESEQAEIVIDPDREERIDPGGEVVLREASLERLQVVAHVLAKSAVLAYYESRVAAVFDRVESLAENLRRGRRGPAPELLRQIGDVLLMQTRMVGRVEVTEKPEITWEKPELDRLYERLSAEYELRDRDLALGRKLELITRTAQTDLELLQHRQNLRVEWYIVVLIVVEIGIVLFDLFSGR